MQPWRTVKVFVSSTFRDMHAERDHLTRVVFPRLRDEVAAWRVHLHPIDLRWGLTQDDTARAVEICLDVLEDCRPFFVGLLGGRWGFVPEGANGRSVTALEIERALREPYREIARPVFEEALRALDGDARRRVESAYLFDPGKGRFRVRAEIPVTDRGIVDADLARVMRPQVESFFFFRDPAITDSITAIDFRAEDAEAARKLLALKEEIRDAQARRGLPEPVIYGCTPRQETRGGATFTALGDLEPFGNAVHDALLAGIARRFGESAPGPAARVTDDDIQETFRARRADGFVGRTTERATLRAFIESHLAPGHAGGWLSVHGAPGTGKSALLARLASDHVRDRPGDALFAHFAGASRASSTVDGLARRLWSFLAGIAPSAPPEPASAPERIARLPELLAAAAAVRPLVLLIDALDQLRGENTLAWLPRRLPARVAVVLSTLEVSPSLRERQSGTLLDLEPLPMEDAATLAREHLAARAKRLAAPQLAALLAHPAARTPLWLLVALEELGLVGRFESIGAQIEELPGDVAGMFGAVLARIEEDHGRDLAERALSYMALSRDGASEVELTAMLGVPASRFAPLLRALRPYLVERGEEIGFFHRELEDAVSARYLRDPAIGRTRHREMAAYFSGLVFNAPAPSFGAAVADPSPPRALRDLPSHLLAGELFAEALTTLTSGRFLQAKAEAGFTEDLAQDVDAAAGGIPPSEQVAHPCGVAVDTRTLASLARAIRRDLAFTAVHPASLVPQIVDLLRWHDHPESAGHFHESWAPRGTLWKLAEHWRVDTAGRDHRVRRLTPPFPPLESALVSAMRGHDGGVVHVAFTADGRRLVTAGVDLTTRVWDVESGRTLHVLPRAVSPVLSADGRRVVAPEDDPGASIPEAAYASYARPVRVYDVDTGDPLATWEGHERFVTCAVLSPNGRQVASACDHRVRVWDASTGREIQTLEAPGFGQITAAAFAPSGRLIAAGDERGAIAVFDREGSIVVQRPGAGRPVLEVAFAGERLLVSTADEGVRLVRLDAASDDVRAGSGGLRTLCTSADRRRAASVPNGGGALRVIDLETDAVVFTQEGETGTVALSPDGSRLAVGTAARHVQVIDVASGTVAAILQGHAGRIPAITFAPEGRRLATASLDGTVRVFDVTTGAPSLRARGHDTGWKDSISTSSTGFVQDAFFDEMARRAVTLGRDGTACLWDVPSGRIVLENVKSHSCDAFGRGFFSRSGERFAVTTLDGVRVLDAGTGESVWSADARREAVSENRGRIALADADGTVRVLDVETGETLGSLRAHEGPVVDLTFLDARRVVSAGEDGMMHVLELGEAGGASTIARERVAPPQSAPRVLRGPSGSIAWSGNDASGIWMPGGARRAVDFGSTFWSAAFSPDGRSAAVRGRRVKSPTWQDSVYVEVFELDSGRTLATLGPHELGGHARQVSDIAFAPDGGAILALFMDPDLRPWVSVWDLADGSLVETVRLAARSYPDRASFVRAAGFPAASGAERPRFRVGRHEDHLAIEGARGVPLATIPERPDAVWLPLAPASPHFLAASSDGHVSFFEVEPAN